MRNRNAFFDDTEKVDIEQARALAELLHSMGIESIRQDFVHRAEEDGVIHLDYFTTNGERREVMVWRKNQ